MKLLFLGTGSAFTVGGDNYQSNLLLTASSGRNLLVDCGSDLRFALHHLGLGVSVIHDIYISHAHADHVGGLEYVGFSTLFVPNLPKPRLFVHEGFASPLWEHTLKGGMGVTEFGESSLKTYFDVHEVPRHFVWEGIDVELIPTPHVRADGMATAAAAMDSYGLMLHAGARRVFITTDTRHAPQELAESYERADVIFHDCETARAKSGVHAHFEELAELPERTRRKMWLYHYNPGQLPDAAAAGFLGFVARGQRFEF